MNEWSGILVSEQGRGNDDREVWSSKEIAVMDGRGEQEEVDI